MTDKGDKKDQVSDPQLENLINNFHQTNIHPNSRTKDHALAEQELKQRLDDQKEN